MVKELSFSEIEKSVEGKQGIVFVGYTRLGYDDVDAVKAYAEHAIAEALLDNNGDASKVFVVANAANQGIGVVYEVACQMGVETFGIVSSKAKKFQPAHDCNNIFYVDSGDWAVCHDVEEDCCLGEDGKHSYTVDVALLGNNTKLVSIGGGLISKLELEEAIQRGANIEISPFFKPNPLISKVEKQQREAEGCSYNGQPVLKMIQKILSGNIEEKLGVHKVKNRVNREGTQIRITEVVRKTNDFVNIETHNKKNNI